MGKALIQSEQGKGKYTATIIHDTARADEQAAALAQQIADIDAELVAVDAELLLKEAELSAIQNELDQAINADVEPGQLFVIVKRLEGPTIKVAKVRNKKALLSADKLAAEKRIAFIENNKPAENEISVWCADYSTGLTGEVGTIEINGTLEHLPIIFPNEIDGSTYDQARDAQMQPIVSSGAAAAYFNRAILPGWQKWLPTYRAGTITDISGDSCSVLLDVAEGQQGLDINQAQILAGISIQYMTQNGACFFTGDRVVVAFEGQNFAQPKVIGFESYPRPDAFAWLMQDTFYNGANSVSIYKHNPDGTGQSLVITPVLAETYSRDLKRVGTDLYFFALHNGAYMVKRCSITTGGNTTVATNVSYLFSVNSTILICHNKDWEIYDRTIRMVDRITGAAIGSFQATVPGVGLATESRPDIWIDCNNEYIYWCMYNDISATNPTLYFCRSDLDGNNHENLATWPLPGVPSNGGSGSWRGYHLTDDRIYVPYGYFGYLGENAPGQVAVPVYCYVYDLEFNLITSFGPLPYGVGFISGQSLCRGFSASEHHCCWIEDTKAGGVYLHYWDRVVARDESGSIVSEQFIKRGAPVTNLHQVYTGISGGIAV